MGIKNASTPQGFWRHRTRPITFSLVVDNFGVKYVGKEHADHLINCLKEEKYIYSWKIGPATYTAASRSDGITRHSK